VADPDDADFTVSAIRWLWDVGSIERSPSSVWGRHPRALAFRVRCDLEARIEGARLAYSQARAALAVTDVALDDALSALEAEAAALQRLRREAIMVADALDGRRWQARL
jgi:hypothetical protein